MTDSDLRILCTDFDGTLFSEHDNPPFPLALQAKIAELQSRGVRWLINTGRDLSSLMEELVRADVTIHPDYVVAVEQEIYLRDGGTFVGCPEWNGRCADVRRELFSVIEADLEPFRREIGARFDATVYEDAYSPFCLIAHRVAETPEIHACLDVFCEGVPGLVAVRNDAYARFSHEDFNKGSALQEICRREGVGANRVIASGDHHNDLTMLRRECATRLIAPANAIDPVREQVRAEGGFLAEWAAGAGTLQGLERFCS
jgi:HAD superfamily hydrolase (TIGR01484 family)